MKELYELIQDRKPLEALSRLHRALPKESEHHKALEKLKTQWQAYESAAQFNIHPEERVIRFQTQELEKFVLSTRSDLDFSAPMSGQYASQSTNGGKRISEITSEAPLVTYPHSYSQSALYLLLFILGLARVFLGGIQQIGVKELISLVVSFLLLGTFVWRISTPYISRYTNSITIKYSLWRHSKFHFSELSRVTKNKNFLTVTLSSGETIRINLKAISSENRGDLFDSLVKKAKFN